MKAAAKCKLVIDAAMAIAMLLLGVWFDRGEIPRVDRRLNAYPFYRTPHCKP